MKTGNRSSTPATNVIIAGTDGSDRSVSAIEWAADEAVLRDHVSQIVHTVPCGGFPGLPLGSVSHAMLHYAHCPVAVVPCLPRKEES